MQWLATMLAAQQQTNLALLQLIACCLKHPEGGRRGGCDVATHMCTLQTRELVQIAEEEEEQAAARPSTSVPQVFDDAPQQRWDCESVLSTRSNLDNHPGTISEQSSRRYKPASGKIKLATKTGGQRLPYLPCYLLDRAACLQLAKSAQEHLNNS